MTAVELAEADLERGHPRVPRERLKSWIAAFPDDRRARCLLARAYREDAQPTEAGRWGYLIESAATDVERLAFEQHAFASSSRITEARLRRLLRCEDLTAIADDGGRARLARRADGLGDRLRRWLATLGT